MEASRSVRGARSRPYHEGKPYPSEKGMSSGMSRRERERARCKREILTAASELFAQSSYEKTGVKQIAERVGVSVGTMYSYFAGKEDILRELLEDSMRDLHRKSDAACSAGDPPLEQLRRRIVAAVEHFKEHIDFLMIYHNENPMLLEGTIRAEVERNMETISTLIESAMDNRDIPRSDQRVLAAVLIGAVQGLMHMFAEEGRRDAFHEVPGIIDRLIFKPLEAEGEHTLGMEAR